MTMLDLVAEARAVGRAATTSTFHTRALAGLLGWTGEGLAAVVVDPTFVRDAQLADVLLVPVPGGVGEVAPGDAAIEPVTALDGTWARVTIRSAPAMTIACDVEEAVARATILLCADALGAAEAAMEAAAAHVTARVQHGRPLATLQVVRHRCADMRIRVTVAESAVLAAAQSDDVRTASSWCKAAVIERCRRVTADAHQLAGGQGILADAPFHRWFRRVKTAEPVLGGNREHRARVAASLIERDPGPTSSR